MTAGEPSAPTKPRILLTTRNFPPLVGGMENFMMATFEALTGPCEVALVGPAGGCDYVPEGTPCAQARLRPNIRFLAQNLWLTAQLARKFRPDVVIAGSGVTALSSWIAARSVRAVAICFVHGLDLVASNPAYRSVSGMALRGMDLVIANSSNTRQLALERKIAVDKLTVIHPPLRNMAVGNDAEADIRALCGQRNVILYVGRLSARKGLSEFIERCMPKIVRRSPQTLLLIVGDDATNAIATESESKRIDEAITEQQLDKYVKRLGVVGDKTLEALYRHAALLVLPVIERPGDTEGFGMVAIEAAARGVPTFAFSVGGIPDAVSDGISGFLFPKREYQLFADGIADYLGATDRAFDPIRCQEFAQKFSLASFSDRFVSLINELIKAKTRKA